MQTPSTSQPTRWPFAPLTQAQIARRAAMERKARAGCLARWPAGLTHLPGVRS